MNEDFVINNIEDTEGAPEGAPEVVPEGAPEVVPAASPDPVVKEDIQIQEEEFEEMSIDDPAVSGNEVYQQEIINLLTDMKGDLEDVKRSNDRLLQKSLDNSVYNGVSADIVPNDQSEYVSSNIITKPINDYSVSEALLLIEVVIIIGVILFLSIRKAVFKWR